MSAGYGEQRTFTNTSNFIAVSAPKAGDTWLIGAEHNVVWTSSGVAGTVTIAFYQNGMLVYQPEPVANSGSYSLLVQNKYFTEGTGSDFMLC